MVTHIHSIKSFCTVLQICIAPYRKAKRHVIVPGKGAGTKTGWIKTMGRAKEQHKLIKLCVANYWLQHVIIVFEPTIFFDGRKISSNQKRCLAWKAICIPEGNETASPQRVDRKPVRKDSQRIGKLKAVGGPLNPYSTGMLWMDVWKVCDGSVRCAYSVHLPVFNTEHMKAKTIRLCSDNKCDLFLTLSKGQLLV